MRTLSVVLFATGVLALGGCADQAGGADVATAGGTGGPSASGPAVSDDPEERGRQFARCMREQGIDMPDPGADQPGRMRIEGGEAEKVEAAMEKCRQYAPFGPNGPKMDPADIEKARQFSKCMRENGIPDFPDPDPETGMIRIQGGPGTMPDRERMEAAHEKCQQYAPRPRGTTK